MKKLKVAQIGTFDVENYGDILFPNLLKFKLKDIDVDLYSPKGGKKPFEEETYVYSLDELEENIVKKKYNALIVGGGDLIRLDKQVANVYKETYSNALSIWQLPVLLSKKYNIPIIYNSPGVPYDFRPCERNIINLLMKDIDYISVRDNESKEILKTCNVKNVKVVPDTILCIDEAFDKKYLDKIKEKLEKEKKIPKIENYITLQHNISNINNSYYIEKMKNLIELITKKYDYNVLLIPIGYVHNDIKFLEKLYDKTNEKLFIIKEKLSPIEMLSVFSNCSGYIGTSMHGAVTTYAYGNPIMLINIKKLVKIGGLLDLIDKRDIEVNNIDDIEYIFENKFFNTSEKTHIKVKNIINKHFDEIKNIISDSKKSNSYNYEKNLLTGIYNEFEKIHDNDFYKAKIYLDIGEGFSEDNILVVNWITNNGVISFDQKINKEVKRVRIDPIEDMYMKYNGLNIKINSEQLDYYVQNSINIDDGILIGSLDPQILINTNSDKDFVLHVSMHAETMDYKNIQDVFIKFESDNEKIEEKNKEIDVLKDNIKKLEKSYKKTIRYKIHKIKEKFIK